jgi:flagellar protein FlgJ
MTASPIDPMLAALRREARAEPQKAARAAAVEFEQLFVQMLLKSMREASPQADPLASDATRMFQGMLDQQWAKTIAARGIGLAPVIEKQLTRNAGFAKEAFKNAAPPADGVDKAQTFMKRMLEPAKAASRATGLPPAFILGQAALESGWGSREPRLANGAPSYNLFGIKAGSGWRGATVEAASTEYVNGQPRRRMERFRAYGSYEEAFSDYARLLTQSGRYNAALSQKNDPAQFARAIQRAGYATDPAYADKLARTIRQALTVSA